MGGGPGLGLGLTFDTPRLTGGGPKLCCWGVKAGGVGEAAEVELFALRNDPKKFLAAEVSTLSPSFYQNGHHHHLSHVQHPMPWMKIEIRTFKPNDAEDVSALLLDGGEDRWLFL